MRLRFDERELELLHGAEQLQGAAMAQAGKPESLREALRLAKAGQKIGRGVPGGTLVLEERELGLLLQAVRFGAREVPVAGRSDVEAHRRDAVLAAFPELVEKGSWRSFGLARELDELATRLDASLKGES